MRMSIRTVATAVVSVCLGAMSASDAARAGALDLEQRVEARRAMEQVSWAHRIWPESNPGPKPPLQAVLPDAVLRRKVEDDLARATALEQLWQLRVTPQQLQAEMERMAAGTRDPDRLRELFAALGNDPRLIAECLVRPLLVDHRIRAAYANDSSLHASQRAVAVQALSRHPVPADMRALGGSTARSCGGSRMVQTPALLPQPRIPRSSTKRSGSTSSRRWRGASASMSRSGRLGRRVTRLDSPRN